MQIQPYLYFEGTCEEALNFYKTALGAEIQFLMRFKDCPVPTPNAQSTPEKIMHATVRIGESTINASDGHCNSKAAFQGFALSILAKDDADAARLFTALTDGGKADMPLAKTFFSSSFGMATDRFGMKWMVMVPSKM